jgi:hypothetical protein
VKWRISAADIVTNPWSIASVAALSIAAASALVISSRPEVNQAVENAAAHGVAGFNTVAAMIAARSPGERPAGELASLKPKRHVAPHERALAKVRPAAPTTLATIVAPVGSPPAFIPSVAATAPLFNTVAPPLIVPAEIPIPGAPTSGFPPITPPGGGGLIVPPILTPSVTPVTPATPVPEPSSWAMMLVGLVLMGRIIARKGAAASG